MAKNTPSTSTPVETINHSASAHSIVVRPVITEKSYGLFQKRQYTFLVNKEATKDTVAKAVESLYNVKVLQVRMIVSKPQKVFIRGKRGVTSASKKAIVSLQDGYTINI